jgi:ClpP class serine protease
MVFTAILRRFCATLVFWLPVATIAWADVQITKSSDTNSYTIWITGAITERDAEEVRKAVHELERANFVSVWLNSEGGAVFPSMELGRAIRRYEGWTIIPNTPNALAVAR